MRTHLGVAYGLALVALLGCVSTSIVMVGQARAAISPDQVRIFLQPPTTPYEQIANLAASSRGGLALTSGQKSTK
jgi:uncharacterized membrane protein YedE/YeeE